MQVHNELLLTLGSRVLAPIHPLRMRLPHHIDFLLVALMRRTQYFLLGSVSRLGVIGFLVMGGFVGQGLLAGELGLY